MKGYRSHRIGVRGKLVLPLLLLVVLSVWLLGLALMQLTKSSLKAQLAARVEVIAAAAENILRASPSKDVSKKRGSSESPVLLAFLESLVENPDVEAVEILDSEGRLLVNGSPTVSTPEGIANLKEVSQGSLDFLSPLVVGPGEIGNLGVRFSRHSLQRQLALSHLQIIIQLLITALILIIFIHILVSLTVLAPIRKLLSATEIIGAGNLDYCVTVEGRDEFGGLARSFNTMMERLRKSEKKVLRQLASLRQAHDDIQSKERELTESEKMAAVGRVAAGVAHEVGNPLGSVTGYMAMLRGEDLSPEEWKDYLDRAEKELARINRIMLDLLNYARPPQLEWTDIDINILLREIRLLLLSQRELAGISLTLNCEEGLPPVRGDLHRTQQMLVNIILNAAQSMPDGGPVLLESFRTATAALPVGVRVTDRGGGISEEHLAHIFEPFCTSRGKRGGSGLGLALCRQIALSMGASIEVESKTGEGSSFTILFPVMNKSDKEP